MLVCVSPSLQLSHSMWDFWWAKWHWDRSFPSSLILISSGGWTLGPFVAAVQRHSLTPWTRTWTTSTACQFLLWRVFVRSSPKPEAGGPSVPCQLSAVQSQIPSISGCRLQMEECGDVIHWIYLYNVNPKFIMKIVEWFTAIMWKGFFSWRRDWVLKYYLDAIWRWPIY